MADGLKDERLRRAVLLMEERINRSFDIAWLATAVGLSRRQLERLFIAETSQSPAAFRAAMRLRYADWLMRTTDTTMTQIALACGYSDLAHLSRRYAVAYGKPPSAARRTGGYQTGERRPYQS